MFEKLQGINTLGLSGPWDDYKPINYSQKWKCKKQSDDPTQNICKGLTQWDLVSLGPTIKKKHYSQTW